MKNKIRDSKRNSIRKHPLFSVVIPAYERSELLERALDSLTAQTCQDFEVIVIDDASKSNLKSIVNRYGHKYQYIRNEVNLGGAESRNIGINAANGIYIAFLDSDDYWYQSKLTKCEEVLKKGTSTKVIFNAISIVKACQKKNTNFDKVKLADSYLDFIVNHNGHLQTSGLVIERKLALETLFKKGLPRHQDLDFYVRLGEYFKDTYFLGECLSVWDISHENKSISRSIAVEESMEWIRDVRSIVGDKTYYNFILKYIFARNITTFIPKEFEEVILGVKQKNLSIFKVIYFTMFRWYRIFRG